MLLHDSFSDIIYKNEDIELYEFNKALQILEYSYINELSENAFTDLLSNVSSNIKKKIKFIQEIVKITGNNLKNMIEFFKDKQIFKIFKVIGFSISKIVKLYKEGVSVYNNIQDLLAKKIASLGGVKYIKRNLKQLDDWFNTNPTMKRIGGFGVAGLLFHIWLNMSYTPDIEYSLDFTDMINALMGKFSMVELFATESGIAMLIYLASGMLLGVSFPIPGTQITQIITGVVWSSYKLVKPKNVTLEKIT